MNYPPNITAAELSRSKDKHREIPDQTPSEEDLTPDPQRYMQAQMKSA